MIFNSYIFIFLFLSLVIFGYFFLNATRKYQLALVFLCIMSFIFYGYLHPAYLFFIFGSILFNYFVYFLLKNNNWQNENTGKHFRKIILLIAIAANLSVLLYFKYFNFFVDNINLIFKCNLQIRKLLFPLGISFITFQQIAFVVDAYCDEVPRYNFLQYTLFISFFPRLSAGPIVMHSELIPLFAEEKRKKINWDNFADGLYMFCMGLGKKVLIADMFGNAVDWGYSHIFELNTTSALFVTIAYTVQIYFDFSGYSDMAIGISRMLNLNLPVNFNSPYKSITIIDFWDRWHITLTRFLTKYLYIPLGGSRNGKIRTTVNTLLVFLCSGLWHGASWTFIMWGGCMVFI